MTKLLLEIGTEEIPAAFIPPALEQLAEYSQELLKGARLTYSTVSTYATPRRLALIVSDLSMQQPDLAEEIKGPPSRIAVDQSGNLTKAGLGFARKLNLDQKDLITKEIKGQAYLYAIKKTPGLPAKDILPALLTKLIDKLSFPKPMRWGSNPIRFARPIRWLVTLLGNQLLSFDYAGLKSDFYSKGHRFLGKASVKIASASDYVAVLKQNYVIADMAERREMILAQIKEIENTHGLRVMADEKLLTEVTCLVEYPTAFLGKFQQEFLELPEEVIITPMREHQRYFPVRYSDSSLADYFVGVRNGTAEYIDTVISGNEKVLAARLADARFFFTEDQNNGLEFYLEKLKSVVYQEKLGTLYQKTLRITSLTDYLSQELTINDQEAKQAHTAARLCKADLATAMVYEFPELQGIMGEKYALNQGYPANVAKAIREHYLPQSADDDLPQTIQGIVVALADKIDTIVGCLAAGIKASGSQDPYGLRRQATGITRILIENKLTLSLKELNKVALDQLPNLGNISENIFEELAEFFAARLRHYLQIIQGYPYDIVDSVLNCTVDDLYAAYCKAAALNGLKQTAEFNSLITAFKRANNLAQKAAWQVLNPNLLQHDSEYTLYQRYSSVQPGFKEAISARDYKTAFSLFASLEQPINNFFENVMVMDEDEGIKNNRLALLQAIVSMTAELADLTQIVVE